MPVDNGAVPVRSEPLEPLITELEIKKRIAELAESIARDYRGKDLVVVTVLKGGFMFTADLLRRLHLHGASPQLEFIRAASYGGGERSGGAVRIELDTCGDLEGRDVLLVDDILDTSATLRELHARISAKCPATLRTCVLLDKPERREAEFAADYVGFTIPDAFVVGYGLDFAERHRELPFITTKDAVEGPDAKREA